MTLSQKRKKQKYFKKKKSNNYHSNHQIMKLRNLFLAGIAAFAMASCSNEVEGIDNGDNGNAVKNATVRFSIGFPATTRAASTEAGTDAEQGIQKITAVLVYNDGSPIQVLNFAKNELAQEKTTVTTDAKEVYAGSGNVYVYVNSAFEITADNYLTATASAAYNNTLDGLVDNIAKADNFLMSGKSNFTAVAGLSTNTAKVTVSRVAAKIREASSKDAYTAKSQENLKITLKRYTFTNLNKTSNVLAGSIFKPENNSGYFQYFKRDNTALKTFDGLATKTIGEESTNITYCMENENSDATTQILYEAQATIGDNEIKNLYVVTSGDKQGVYPSFEDLDKAYGNQLSKDAYGNLSDASDYGAFSKYGIKKYTDGICYYAQDITTNGVTAAKIMRNNIYQLTVKGIDGLGEPGIDIPTPGDPITMLDLEISIPEWTFNENSFNL